MEFPITATFTATLARLAGPEPTLRAGKSQNWLSSGRASPLVLARTHDARATHVLDAWAAAAARHRPASCRQLLQRVNQLRTAAARRRSGHPQTAAQELRGWRGS
jgi:hypothetical protein